MSQIMGRRDSISTYFPGCLVRRRWGGFAKVDKDAVLPYTVLMRFIRDRKAWVMRWVLVFLDCEACLKIV